MLLVYVPFVLLGVVQPGASEPEYLSRLISGDVTSGPVVNTQYGPILGRLSPASSVTEDVLVEEFLGIPFSRPPVGERRWKKPEPLADGWQGTLNGTVYGPHCIQAITDLYPLNGIGGEQSEDCLTLNIFRPVERSGALPVMVYAFGGGYQMGTGEPYPGGFLATEGKVISINYNYRTNTIGFLSTGDSVIPGNYGLWDTRAMLQWIQENIASFGGDPSRVTLFGQSAGGGVVSHSVLSPTMSGLFQRGMTASGSAAAVWSYTLEERDAAFALADYFWCGAETSEEVLSCLKEEDAEDLEFWGNAISEEYDIARVWLPCIDGDFIQIDPIQGWLEGKGIMQEVDFMSGSTYHDSAGFILNNPVGLPIINDSLNMAYNKSELFGYIKGRLAYAQNADALFDMILERYPGLDSENNFTRTIVGTQTDTEGVFEMPTHFEARSHVRNGGPRNTYVFMFKHRQSFFLEGYPPWVQGSHLDDIYTYLGPPFFQVYRDDFLGRDFDETDLQMSRDTIKYLSNFAHTGNPNEGLFEPQRVWPQYDSEQRFIQLSPEMSVRTPDAEKKANYQFLENLPDIPRRSGSRGNKLRRTPTVEELLQQGEKICNQMYEKVGYYEPAIEVVDRRCDRAISRMLDRHEKQIKSS